MCPSDLLFRTLADDLKLLQVYRPTKTPVFFFFRLSPRERTIIFQQTSFL